MGVDEAGTLAALRSHRAELIDGKIAAHGGRIVKTMGDGLLLEYPSVVDATQSMVEIQLGMIERNQCVDDDRRITFRIGVNLGDIIIEGDDILGDGVNIAARLQEIAEPGGVAISGRVHDDVRDRLDAGFADAGEQTLKNIARPVRVWQWSPAGSATEDPVTTDASLPLPDKPSIAVLSFDNMSGDPEQEYFADGMAEDIISGLSKFSGLFVIARNSSFSYKGKSIDVRTMAKTLGVRYVLEGSIRQIGSRVRVTGQLIDTSTGSHIWAERYDRTLDDIFAVQDEVTSAIILAIAPEIGQAEIIRARRKPPNNVDSWALYQRGLALNPSGHFDERVEAIQYFDKAIDADPTFVDAIVMAGHMRARLSFFNNPINATELETEARSLLDQAMRLDPRHSACHSAMARILSFQGDHERGIAFGRDGVALNPNSFSAVFEYGVALMLAEQYEEAIQQFDLAERMSPKDLYLVGVLAAKAVALFSLGRYEESVTISYVVQKLPNPRSWAEACLVAGLAKLKRGTEMQTARDRLFSQFPDFKISTLPGGKASQVVAAALREIDFPE